MTDLSFAEIFAWTMALAFIVAGIGGWYATRPEPWERTLARMVKKHKERHNGDDSY